MERLDPRIRLLWAFGALLAGLLPGVGAGVVLIVGLNYPRLTGIAAGAGLATVIAILGIAYAILRYRAWRFELQDDALYLERGVLTEVRTVLPYVRVQHVDTQRNPIERVLGLSRVVVYTAGSRGADVSVPGLTVDRARDLREDLRRRTREHEGGDGV